MANKNSGTYYERLYFTAPLIEDTILFPQSKEQFFGISFAVTMEVEVMKRLVIITVGKTHSGKTTFARALEKELYNSFVMDQDNHAEFINTYYKNLQPKQGPNTLKHALSKLIVDYAKEHTDLNLIICN